MSNQIEGSTVDGSFLVWRENDNLHCSVKTSAGECMEVSYWNQIPHRMVDPIRDAVEKVFPDYPIRQIDPRASGFREVDPDSCNGCGGLASSPKRRLRVVA